MEPPHVAISQSACAAQPKLNIVALIEPVQNPYSLRSRMLSSFRRSCLCLRYPVSQARNFNDDGTFKLQAMVSWPARIRISACSVPQRVPEGLRHGSISGLRCTGRGSRVEHRGSVSGLGFREAGGFGVGLKG